MKYEYVVAYRVVGGVHLPKGASDFLLCQDQGVTATLTCDDSRLRDLDQAVALSNAVLDRLFTGTGSSLPFADDVAERAKKLRDERIGAGPVTSLLVEISGDHPLTLGSTPLQFDSYEVHWDAINKSLYAKSTMPGSMPL